MKNKSGIDLINDTRLEQIFVHQKTPGHDLKNNSEYQLKDAARALLYDNFNARLNARPTGWPAASWEKHCCKNYSDRLRVSGALLAAELDRIELISINKSVKAELELINNTYSDLFDLVNTKYKSKPGAVEVLKGLTDFKDLAKELISEGRYKY